MNDVLEHLEAAITEVSRAREAVLRSNSPQVRSAEERDRLKAVAFAWFKTHRPQVGNIDAVDVDAAYQTVLDSTAKLAARPTYATALKTAKAALVGLRRHVLAAPPTKSTPALAATVMMGGLLETLLLARINVVVNKAAIFTAKNAPKDRTSKTLALSEWKLVAMVEVAHEVGWITKSVKDVGNVLRDFRNYIHPHKEHTDGVQIGAEDVRMFWEVCKTISRQILASVGNTP